VSRGARALGVSGSFNTAVEGGNLPQIVEGAKNDVVNSLAHPFLGPVPRAGIVAATGKQPYLVRDTDTGGSKPLPAAGKHAPLGTELLEAAKQLNSFYGNVGAATGFGNPQDKTQGNLWLKAVIDMTGLNGGAHRPDVAASSLQRERTAIAREAAVRALAERSGTH